MRERITRSQLEHMATRINKLTGSPLEPWRTHEGHNSANVGNFHISGAYGGFCLHRVVNERGGVETPLSCGHIPARDLYERLRAYASGIELGRKLGGGAA